MITAVQAKEKTKERITQVAKEFIINVVEMTVDEAISMAKSIGVNASDCISWGKVVSEVFDERVEPNLVQPTLVMDMPKDISPLAKTHRDNPRLVEHFDAYVAADFAVLENLVKPLTEMEKSYITAMSPFYEEYQNIKCYTKQDIYQ